MSGSEDGQPASALSSDPPTAAGRGDDETRGTPPPPSGPVRPDPGASSRVATVPNLLSLIRMLLIPVFVWLILGRGTGMAGLLLLAGVVATDWVDGYIARHTGQISNVGKVLDPVADRLAITAALAAMVARGVFPLWAALLVIVRDAAILVAGGILLATVRVRLDVRWIGKAGTFGLMFAIPLIAWANFGLTGAAGVRVAGWTCFWPGIALYYAAAAVYAFDIAAAVRRPAASDRRV